jgi:chromosome condensin MukBEF complex kleisin-like MukF subunit
MIELWMGYDDGGTCDPEIKNFIKIRISEGENDIFSTSLRVTIRETLKKNVMTC